MILNKQETCLKISDLLYVDARGKLCCTETLDSAIKLVKYNEKNKSINEVINMNFVNTDLQKKIIIQI